MGRKIASASRHAPTHSLAWAPSRKSGAKLFAFIETVKNPSFRRAASAAMATLFSHIRSTSRRALRPWSPPLGWRTVAVEIIEHVGGSATARNTSRSTRCLRLAIDPASCRTLSTQTPEDLLVEAVAQCIEKDETGYALNEAALRRLLRQGWRRTSSTATGKGMFLSRTSRIGCDGFDAPILTIDLGLERVMLPDGETAILGKFIQTPPGHGAPPATETDRRRADRRTAPDLLAAAGVILGLHDAAIDQMAAILKAKADTSSAKPDSDSEIDYAPAPAYTAITYREGPSEDAKALALIMTLGEGGIIDADNDGAARPNKAPPPSLEDIAGLTDVVVADRGYLPRFIRRGPTFRETERAIKAAGLSWCMEAGRTAWRLLHDAPPSEIALMKSLLEQAPTQGDHKTGKAADVSSARISDITLTDSTLADSTAADRMAARRRITLIRQALSIHVGPK